MSRTQRQPDFEQRADAQWVYAGRTILVPGAQTLTLGESVTPRELRRPGREPEAAVFSLSEIIAEPGLNWVLQEGTRLRGGEEDAFSVPWDRWLAHVGETCGIWAPERDGTGIVRQLATDEREVRFARDAFERALETRSRRVAFASFLGMSRRQVGELLGVSATRVQQLLEEISVPVRQELEQLAVDCRTVLDALPDGSVARSSIAPPQGWREERLARVLDELVEHGLIDAEPSTGTLWVAGWSTFRGKRLRLLPRREGGAVAHG